MQLESRRVVQERQNLLKGVKWLQFILVKKKKKFKNYDLCQLINNKKVLSQGESLNISENTASRVCNACDNGSPVVPSPKVWHILKGLQISSAKSNIKKLDLNLLKTFSIWVVDNSKLWVHTVTFHFFYSALNPSNSQHFLHNPKQSTLKAQTGQAAPFPAHQGAPYGKHQ